MTTFDTHLSRQVDDDNFAYRALSFFSAEKSLWQLFAINVSNYDKGII